MLHLWRLLNLSKRRHQQQQQEQLLLQQQQQQQQRQATPEFEEPTMEELYQVSQQAHSCPVRIMSSGLTQHANV